MLRVEPGTIKTADLHEYILGAVAPRPIAFASTLDETGVPNLAPFSFFNAIGSKPPILVFSANRRVRNNTTKDTYTNIKANHEVVINVVNFEIVRQAALCSIEYPSSVNEFVKSGLTPIASEKVKPFRVEESPVQFECHVREIHEYGQEGGAANLFICDILLMHIDEDVLDENGKINPFKIDLVARMGQSFYSRAAGEEGESIFEIKQPVSKIGIGFDQLPDFIRNDERFTSYELGQLASIEKIPADEEVRIFKEENADLIAGIQKDSQTLDEYIARLLSEDNVETAWKIILSSI